MVKRFLLGYVRLFKVVVDVPSQYLLDGVGRCGLSGLE